MKENPTTPLEESIEENNSETLEDAKESSKKWLKDLQEQLKQTDPSK